MGPRLMVDSAIPRPLIVPIGDQALLVRFGDALTDEANRAAIGFAARLEADCPVGVEEIDPNLISVLLRYDADRTDPERLAGEIRMLLGLGAPGGALEGDRHQIGVRFDGPDLAEVAESLNLSSGAFISAHNARPLRVLTTGFAPGFVYCGFHPDNLKLPRRASVRARVEAGTVLFAAGQTAITATVIPTGWHVIGTTDFRNFDVAAQPPTQLKEGDTIVFAEAAI
jgi:5-oxoprolinase (ATP-hydrolysing) subunit B